MRRWSADAFVRELLERLFVVIGKRHEVLDEWLKHSPLKRDVTGMSIWWALKSALAFFRDNTNAFPFFREFGDDPEELDATQVALCLVEMNILWHDGNKPEAKRKQYAHFGECGPCSHFLTHVTVLAFVHALEGCDFGTVFRRAEKARDQQIIGAVLEMLPKVACGGERQAELVVKFLRQVGPEDVQRAAQHLVDRFGDLTKGPPTDDELEKAFREFTPSGPSHSDPVN
jgi:hypothetical protein